MERLSKLSSLLMLGVVAMGSSALQATETRMTTMVSIICVTRILNYFKSWEQNFDANIALAEDKRPTRAVRLSAC